jgi:hypothetical protein
MKSVFNSLSSLIHDYLNEEIDISEEEIMSRIDEAYEEGDLTGREYDKLICML